MEILTSVPLSAPNHRKTRSFGISNRLQRRAARLLGDGQGSRLLDVNNAYILNAQSLPKDNDRNEVAGQLRGLRSHYDRELRSASVHKRRLSVLRDELCTLDVRERLLVSSEEKIGQLQGKMQEVRIQQEGEKNQREVYLHLLDRARTTNVHLKFKTEKLKEQIRLAQRDLTLKQNLIFHNYSKEAKARTVIRRLKEDIKHETKIRVQDLAMLTNDMNSLNASKLRKEALHNTQQEKLESLLIKQRSKNAESLRDKLFMTKFWYLFMTARFEKEKEKWDKIEEAFQKIKLRTGHSEISNVVHNFLTKEKNLFELIRNVKEKESQLEMYRRKHENIQAELEHVQLNHQNTGELGNKNAIRETIKQTKMLNEALAKLNKVKMATDKTKEWILRVKRKFTVADSSEDTLLGDFKRIRDKIRELIHEQLDRKTSTVYFDEGEFIE